MSAGTAHLLRADMGTRLGWCWALGVNWHTHGWDYGGVRPIAPAVDRCPTVLADLALGFAFAAERVTTWAIAEHGEHTAEVDPA